VIGALTRLLHSGQFVGHVDAAIAWCKEVVVDGRLQKLLTAASEGKLLKYLRQVRSIKLELFLCAKFPAPPALEQGPHVMAAYADMLVSSGLGDMGQNASSPAEAGNSAIKGGNRRGGGLRAPSRRWF
jgi:hypothetical protein